MNNREVQQAILSALYQRVLSSNHTHDPMDRAALEGSLPGVEPIVVQVNLRALRAQGLIEFTETLAGGYSARLTDAGFATATEGK